MSEKLIVNDEGRDCFIKTIIIDHWRENGGRVPAFGGITGYVLVLVAGYSGVDFGLPFSEIPFASSSRRSSSMRRR